MSDELGGLPDSWSWVTLADVLAEPLVNGRSVKTMDGGFPVLRLTAISGGNIDLGESKEGAWTAEQASPFFVRRGDFLLSRGNGSRRLVGRGGLVGDVGHPVAFPDTMIRVRLTQDVILPSYFRLLWDSPLVRMQVEAKARTTAGIYKVNQAILEAVALPLPPVAEQRRIVETLEEQLSRLDAAVVSVEASSRRVRGLRAAALSAALESVGDSPVRRLADVLKEPLRNGHSAKATTDPGGIRTLNLTAVTQGDFSDENTKLTVADPHRVRDLWLTRGDILVQRSNTPDLVGTAAMYAGDNGWAIFPDLLIRVRVCEGVLPEYATLVLQSRDGRSYFKSRAKGLAGSMPKIDQSAIENFRIPVPSLDAQKRVVAEVQEQFDRVSRLSAELDRARKRSDGLRRALLRTAFNGCLVPQDSKDEPAPRLLARIAAERAAQPKPKRARKTAAKPPAQRVADVTAPEPTTAPALAVQQEFEL
ncbi:restriction endonuclease subunit S [Streptomyces olivaceus]|uniref:restriction endonuclease subunit S n=1 Tax=Streptomyces olivaceus TaxID=47716 RepID=UPI001CCEB471|nr:restriction endonuclease subunit S [Streptomyces olivaceus]MBZ6289322.1 restriction endonuclease subunit S [Streptomyces olivaceus]MBZ6325316.1 restriction endonuclease subunit S [Streptomyces olivaceus]MBZ6330615.1 restriction endonuclease subunit S [Streptomyces olivaceus]